MIIGENNNRSHPTVHIPQWDQINDPTVTISSPFSSLNGVNDYPHSPSSPFSSFNGVNDYPHSPSLYLDSFASLCRYLPSNELTNDSDSSSGDESDSFASDEFRMYEFKIRRCSRGRSHDWTECPYAHPGEKARRRDPRKFHYSGNACPEFRKGNCRRGDSCEFAHGVFECWLHPSRYRTQPCKDGSSCRRKICFFAHTTEQLRVLPCSFDPDLGGFASSPTSILVSPPFSPPLSPTTGELIASMRKMQLNGGGGGGCSWSSPMRSGVRLPFSSSLRPIQAPTWTIWENECEEVPAMEFVESGRELREKMYAKLSRENSLG